MQEVSDLDRVYGPMITKLRVISIESSNDGV